MTKITWTDSAEQAWREYFAARAAALATTGADVEEVSDDLRRHVESAAVAEGVTILTQEYTERFLARQDLPGISSAPSRPASTVAEAKPPRRTRYWRQGGFVLFTVLLPAVAIVMEMLMGVTAGVAFDPMPTIGHFLLILLVPTANLLVWRAARSEAAAVRRPWLIGWLSGAAIAIASFYAALYTPLVPLSLIGILVMGLGFLGLTPFFALYGAVRNRFLLRRTPAGLAREMRLPLWPGVASGIFLLFLVSLPGTLARIGLNWSASHDHDRQQRGLFILRTFGSEDAVLRACYLRPSGISDPIGFIFTAGHFIGPEEARRIYYLAYGRAFNDAPRPHLRRGGSWNRWGDDDDRGWDSEQGGETVGGRLRHLTLTTSRLDGSADADAGHAYVEWMMMFRNTSPGQQEARAQLALPPGATVSRLTLWVDGEEREAAFAGRAQTRQAYRQVVSARRDPVLVTTTGPDRVMVQCFPVPANGTMKIRLGITCPLPATSERELCLVMPHIVERNFEYTAELMHQLWVEAPQPVRIAEGIADNDAVDTVVRAALTTDQLVPEQSALTLTRSAQVTQAWCADARDTSGGYVLARWEHPMVAAAPYTVFVIDGSQAVREAGTRALARIRQLPPSFRHEVMYAADKPGSFTGGQDNVPILEAAWDAASREPGAVVVWLHGPQPVDLTEPETLRQRRERRPEGPRLITFALVDGPQRVLEKLDGVAGLEAAPQLGGAAADLTRLLDRLQGNDRLPTLVRESVAVPPAGAVQTSAHLARLFARERVDRLLLGNAADRRKAMVLASRYQLVTPVTGAVVLENQRQYEQAGLTPVDPESVPTIPEPSTIALLIAVAALLAVQFRKRRVA